MSLIKINQSAIEAKQRQGRITELRQLLLDTDYKVLPDYDKPNEDIKAQRAAWRVEIRELESDQ
jgi:hypothetical protein